MPPKKRVVRRRAVRRPMMGGRKRRVMGRGFLDSIRSGLSSANDFLRDNRLISRGLRMIPGKYSEPLANLASTAGYGRRTNVMSRKRTARVARRSGRGFMDWVNKANDFLKDNRLISRGLSMIPGKYSQPLAALASTAGYGRKRRGGMMLSPPFMGGMKKRRMVGGRIIFPSVYTAGLGGMSATTY